MAIPDRKDLPQSTDGSDKFKSQLLKSLSPGQRKIVRPLLEKFQAASFCAGQRAGFVKDRETIERKTDPNEQYRIGYSQGYQVGLEEALKLASSLNRVNNELVTKLENLIRQKPDN